MRPSWVWLHPFGIIWGAVMGMRNALYDRRVLATPDPGLAVVAVGNLTVGGTGKTPWVSHLLRLLERPGRSLGVLTRGYGGHADEPRLLASRHPEVPIEIDPDRIRGARALRARGVDLAIADDAFQHRRLRRVVDLLLVDSRCPFGNGRVLPAGLLREHVSGARRADLIVITRSSETEDEARARLRRRLEDWVPRDRIFDSDLVVESWWSLAQVSDWGTPQARSLAIGSGPGRVIALSAIGNPESFHRTLVTRGLEIADRLVHRDHRRLTDQDVANADTAARRTGADWIACTEKDLWNLPAAWRPRVPLLVPRLEVTVEREADLLRFLEARLAGAS